MSNDKLLHVMVADDDPDDRMIFERAFEEANVNGTLQFAKDGNDLMTLLLKPNTVIPDILFLDLNMPLKNGFECLTEIKMSEMLREIFVVICSTSGSQHEVEETFKNGANLFMIKLNTFNDLKNSIAKISGLDHHDYLAHPVKERYFFRNKP